MAADNRLTAEQLAALAPGDRVTIESGAEFARRRYATGTVAWVSGPHVMVRCGPYLEQYRLRDGVRVGGVGHAELVSLAAGEAAADTRRRTAHIDALYREWARNRTDVDRLRRLRDAIEESLGLPAL